jgi:hypothetical protein
MTSNVCAAIKTKTVAIMVQINSKNGHGVLFPPIAFATQTTTAVTKAWIAMLQILAALPTRN